MKGLLARCVPGLAVLAALVLGCIYGEAHQPIAAWHGLGPGTTANWSQRISQLEEKGKEEHIMIMAVVEEAKSTIMGEVRREVRAAKTELIASLGSWATTVTREPAPKVDKPAPPPVRKPPQQTPKTSTAKASKPTATGVFR